MLAYNQPLGRLARLPLKLIPPSRVMTVRAGALKGARWIAGSHTHGCWLGTYESDKQRLFVRDVKPGMVVYDIGANVGFYTLLSSRLVGDAGRVYAFEPLPRNLDLLERHIKLNRMENVTVVGAAVSAAEGEATFATTGPAIGALSQTGELKVRTVALDSFEGRKPDVLKIDVEGGEIDVLRGGAELLKEHGPLIFLATHGKGLHRACIEFLTSLGYKIELLDPAEILASRQ